MPFARRRSKPAAPFRGGLPRALAAAVAGAALTASLVSDVSAQRPAGVTSKVTAKDVLTATGVRGGFVVHLGCGDGKLTASLRAGDSYMVHGLARDAADVEQARRLVRALGLYGPVSIDRLDGKRLPYIDNMVNLLVAEDLGGVSMDEVIRVLVPEGVAYVKRDGQWTATRKPRPEAMDEWTHYLGDASNNAVSKDDLIGPPRRYQWLGTPRWSRHHDHMASMSALVASGGRIFYIMDEGSRISIETPPDWKLIARDAFNGTVLWKRPIARWHTHLWPLKSGPSHLPRRLVAVGERVYVTLGIEAPISVLDAATGETIRTLEKTAATEEMVVQGDTIFALVSDNPVKRYQPRAAYTTIAEIKKEGNSRPWDESPTWVAAVDPISGEVLWKKKSVAVPLTLAADAERVYFHDGEKVVCLGRGDGSQMWASEPVPRWSKILSFFGSTLVVYDGVVIFAGGEKMIPHRGGEDTMTAYDAKTGRVLWTAEHPQGGYQSPEDVLVAGGLVWCGPVTSGGHSGHFKGRDPRTGEVKKEMPPTVQTYWFHHRCYRAKATENYLLTSRTGIEFLDLDSCDWMIHHWVRGGCLYGIMPANGLIYAPPHNCACYPEAKLFGLSGLAPAGKAKTGEAPSEPQRLERAPFERTARDSDIEAPIGPEWPTYRHDNARSGRTEVRLPADLTRAWQTELGGKLTAPVIAQNTLLVAEPERHAVHALDAMSGERRWSFTAGGPIDSPPSIYQGKAYRARAIFGCADGWVYCVNMDDGQLVWRYFAAPEDKRMMALERLESVWPLHGSVLIHGGKVWCSVGRSVFLDGGLRLISLDPDSGQLLAHVALDDRDPETGENLQSRLQILNMPVGLSDILACDGRHMYMRSQVFDLYGKRVELGPHSGDPAGQGSVQRGEWAHLFAPTGFLDDSWFHRSYWVYGRSFAGGHGGYYQAGKYAPSGRILVFDDENVYGYARKPQYYRWTTPLEYHLFSASKEAPEVEGPIGGRGSYVRVENAESLNPANKPLAVEAWVHADKPSGVVVARGGPAHGFALALKGGQPQFFVRGNEELSSVTAKERVGARWVHLAGVLTADKKLQLYVDGKLAASGDAPGLIPSDPKQPMEIGSDEAGAVGDYKSPHSFTGLLDEVRLYLGPVTPAEIAAHAARPTETATDGAELVLRLTFTKGKAADASGKENHAKLVGVAPAKGRIDGALRFTGRRPRGGGSHVEHHWEVDIPVVARAMVLAGGSLLVAGPPDLLDEEHAYEHIADPEIVEKLAAQDEAFEGKRGGLLWAVSASDGQKLGECRLQSPPVFDGMAAAYGRLYVVTMDGRVVCLEGK